MKVEVINTGTEILLGAITNTHLGFLARELFPLGLRVQRQVAVPDGDAICEALAGAFSRAEIVIVTGGLGPTTDDITREITAGLLGAELIHDAAVMRAIEERFARRNIAITERVGRQALVPQGAAVLPNPNGTAPGLYFNTANATKHRREWIVGHLFLLPGPPRELQPMFNDEVIPILKRILPAGEIPASRNFRIVGVGESNVEAAVGGELLAIEGIELGYCARPGEVEVRVIGPNAALTRAEEIIQRHLKAHIASNDSRSLEQVVVESLIARNETLATAESCTGGLLAHRITNVPGASGVFKEGFVTYSYAAKARALGIDIKFIEAHRAVSAEVAKAMAEKARDLAETDYALSTTGLAGPGVGEEKEPVGTVFIALASKRAETIVDRQEFVTDRENFKFQATQRALDLLRRHLAAE